ncbi:Thp2p NDAI_0C03360 [Naumovozyma dairenensis CBS 421]|uniref:Uncharacterized protein n=1 Tax=Naumovozyma dairenensis (strain ATCC 10597 / BCRC 20456 / CBS 421 / NBRC 0211 / NRRL Y-12639) TaxID=1071378 RepID=G0W885_NAUDC|nr:hypothetical protein NDAI_0C03360 [Naumovozyma dairenensis CBS 421]CCD23996.1 hypothetical protein NDAI_0C03360 [Naumovozyma dairenensis CBS 421]
MPGEIETTYFDSLSEQEQHLQENYSCIKDIFKTLKQLKNKDATDDELKQNLDNLSIYYRDLTRSSIDLKYNKYQTREIQLSHLDKISNEAQTFKRKHKTIYLREYVNTTESINGKSLEYINLLQRLSVDLVRQIEISDPNVSKINVDGWNPPKKIQVLLDKFGEPDADTRELKIQVQRYLDDIKMSRAKYSLENKYSLQEKLSEVTKAVNQWRAEWDNIEMMLFGDGSNSMKNMLANVESIKSKLEEEAKAESKEEEGEGEGNDVEMT